MELHGVAAMLQFTAHNSTTMTVSSDVGRNVSSDISSYVSSDDSSYVSSGAGRDAVLAVMSAVIRLQ